MLAELLPFPGLVPSSLALPLNTALALSLNTALALSLTSSKAIVIASLLEIVLADAVPPSLYFFPRIIFLLCC